MAGYINEKKCVEKGIYSIIDFACKNCEMSVHENGMPYFCNKNKCYVGSCMTCDKHSLKKPNGWEAVKKIKKFLMTKLEDSQQKEIDAMHKHVVPADYQGTYKDAQIYYFGKAMGLANVVDKVNDMLREAGMEVDDE